MNTREFLKANATVTGDISTLSYRDKYTSLVNAVGFEECINSLPATREDIIEAYKNDQYLTKIPLDKWDANAPLLYERLNQIGITEISATETVCIMKQSARMWIEA